MKYDEVFSAISFSANNRALAITLKNPGTSAEKYMCVSMMVNSKQSGKDLRQIKNLKVKMHML